MISERPACVFANSKITHKGCFKQRRVDEDRQSWYNIDCELDMALSFGC